jgi:hypothetical protein
MKKKVVKKAVKEPKEKPITRAEFVSLQGRVDKCVEMLKKWGKWAL